MSGSHKRNCNPPLIKGIAAEDLSQPDQCQRPVGGDMTARPPVYVLTVTNPQSGGGGVLDLFQDEVGNVVVDDTLDSLILNQ